MTLLQYVCELLLGPPAKDGGAYGESWWHCPLGTHDDSNPSFHTLPPLPGKKLYWKCFGCDAYGDAYELLRLLRDTCCWPEAAGGFEDHKGLLSQWEQEWRLYSKSKKGRGSPGASPPDTRRVVPFFPSLTLSQADERAAEDRAWRLGFAYDLLTEEERDAILIAQEVAQREGVSLTDLGVYCDKYRHHTIEDLTAAGRKENG
jgi:hypothetical protein